MRTRRPLSSILVLAIWLCLLKGARPALSFLSVSRHPRKEHGRAHSSVCRRPRAGPRLDIPQPLTARHAEKTEQVKDEPFFEEVSGDDPMVKELEERLRKMNNDQSLTLDMVFNPGTIVNAERDVIRLRAELALTPEENSAKRKELEDKIEEKQMKIVNEMQLVMTDQLKLELLLQGIVSVPAFGAMAYRAFPWVPDLTWVGEDREGSLQILELISVWGIWIFTIPALRARKPGGPYGMGYEEKRALDAAILITPFFCLLMPFVTTYPPAIFWTCLIILALCYVWSFSVPLDPQSEEEMLPSQLRWVLKALDYSRGAERGAVQEDAVWQGKLQAYDDVAKELAAEKAKAKEKEQQTATASASASSSGAKP